MKKNLQTLEESKNKIKFIMDYDSSRTLTEQAGGQKSEVSDDFINSISKTLNKYYSPAEKIINGLNAYTYKGKPALQGVQAAYQAKYGTPLPNKITSTSTGTTPANLQDTYRPAQGTATDPFVPGTMGKGVGQVQQYLGGLKVDNMFGTKTQAALAAKVPQFKDKFTTNDIATIYKTLYPQQSEQKPEVVQPAAANTIQTTPPPASEIPSD